MDESPLLSYRQAEQILADAELIHSANDVMQALQHMADEIIQVLSQQHPLVLCVMNGAVVFAGQLLPRLLFPLDFDYLQVKRYDQQLQAGKVRWQVAPSEVLRDRTILVLDDILDAGLTLAAIREKVLQQGARAFYSAVLVEKQTGLSKPIQADFVGLTVPDRYVFGFGMDIHGAWRNLPAIYAIKNNNQ
jgi:hypoxanthine phosphoribosyltransferase